MIGTFSYRSSFWSLTCNIVTILILEHATIQYASGGATKDALNQAHSRYMVSDAHAAIHEWLTAPPVKYGVEQFTEFICKHRLRLSCHLPLSHTLTSHYFYSTIKS